MTKDQLNQYRRDRYKSRKEKSDAEKVLDEEIERLKREQKEYLMQKRIKELESDKVLL